MDGLVIVFVQLDAAQIKTFVVGKAITDGAHWSDHFYRDGSMKSIELGQIKRGTWILQVLKDQW